MKKQTKKQIVEMVSNYWSNIDNWINTESEHHIGRWSSEEKLELHHAMGKRDAYQKVLEDLGYFKD